MTQRKTIAQAPSGENTSLAGTEKVPVSGNQFTLISTIAAYIRTLTQTLTNKTINLTSNTLTGTTAQFNTALSDNDFATLAGSETLSTKTLASPMITGAITLPDDVRQTFNPGATNAGLNVGAIAGDPSTPSNGDLWYDSTANELTARINSVSVALGAGAAGDSFKTIAVSGQSDVVADSATDTLTLVAGTNVTITTDAGTDSITIAQSGAGGVTGPGSSTDNAIARFDGTSGGAIQNSAITLDDTGVLGFPDNIRQTFNPGADAAGINVGSIAGDPGTPSNGDLWYDSTANELTARVNGSNVSLGAGGGAPTTAEYITSASDGTLSAEVVIPGLAGSADISGAGGAGVSYEFDSGASPLSWSAAVDTETVDSTVKSHLYVQDNGASETLGTYSWSPAGAFDIRCKLSLGSEVGTSATAVGVGLIAGDSAMNNRVFIGLTFDGATDRYVIQAFTYASSTYTQRGATNTGMSNSVYLRIVRDGSNNNSFYWSADGITWILIATQALTYTAANAGLRLTPGSITTTIACDWIRSDV